MFTLYNVRYCIGNSSPKETFIVKSPIIIVTSDKKLSFKSLLARGNFVIF